MSTCAHTAPRTPTTLDQAQEDARKAIHDARDAQRRIDEANADLEAALGAETRRSQRASTSAESADATSRASRT